MADDKTAKIRAWQDKLLAVFSHDGVPGGKYLASAIAAEKKTGGAFMDKWYGHRVLTDSFMELFGETLSGQWTFNNTKGWPQDAPYYAPCLIMYLIIYRSIRSSEVLSANGYSLAAYAVQRGIKDQLMLLCAAANGFGDFDELSGLKGLGEGDWTEEQKAKLINQRQKSESKIKQRIMGKKSDLSAEAQKQLEHWDRLFNWEVHRALFSQTRAAQGLLVDRDVAFSLGPSPDDLAASMFVNRSMELNWIALRLLPYMRRQGTPDSDAWTSKWNLLEESFHFMFDGFNELGKKIAPAYYEMLEAKFKFGPMNYFSEPKAEGAPNEAPNRK
jgi:hypothetical protein